ncbi:hypothetical protein HNQ77_003851 [Silvibacterium bohemicum]|uniref:Uncharacterized protein n=1 Tax=Silvibacterium bohemicum TaxID=1577686 RepID=A0A841K3Z5_9BACT|nr:hypothetical protein [Silvibacterium bohemicum]MBB6145881.1 hypothetical protein [Silvibacterium bohemicum]
MSEKMLAVILTVVFIASLVAWVPMSNYACRSCERVLAKRRSRSNIPSSE